MVKKTPNKTEKVLFNQMNATKQKQIQNNYFMRKMKKKF